MAALELTLDRRGLRWLAGLLDRATDADSPVRLKVTMALSTYRDVGWALAFCREELERAAVDDAAELDARERAERGGWVIVLLDPPSEVELDDLVPWARGLGRRFGVVQRELSFMSPISSASARSLDATSRELTGPESWTLHTIVRQALLPLAWLSLADGQPVVPELGVVLMAVLGDPRLGARERSELEFALLESEEFEGQLLAEF